MGSHSDFFAVDCKRLLTRKTGKDNGAYFQNILFEGSG